MSSAPSSPTPSASARLRRRPVTARDTTAPSPDASPTRGSGANFDDLIAMKEPSGRTSMATEYRVIADEANGVGA
jgi:hypothetical protein